MSCFWLLDFYSKKTNNITLVVIIDIIGDRDVNWVSTIII